MSASKKKKLIIACAVLVLGYIGIDILFRKQLAETDAFNTAIRARAAEDFVVIEKVLADYYRQKNAYPDSLKELPLASSYSNPSLTSGERTMAYSYAPKNKENVKEGVLCKYALTADRVDKDLGLNSYVTVYEVSKDSCL